MSGSKRKAELAVEGAVVGAASAANPIAGVLATSFFAADGGTLVKKWLGIAEDEFSRAGRVLDANDPQVQAVFATLAIGAAQTSRERKWRILATALGNSGAWSESPDFIVEHFAKLAVEYSPEHVKVLDLVDALSNGDEASGGEVLRTRQGLLDLLVDSAAAPPDVHFVFDAVLLDLSNDGLMSAGFINALEAGLSGEEGTLASESPYSLSEKGKRFLRHVTVFPVNDDPAGTGATEA